MQLTAKIKTYELLLLLEKYKADLSALEKLPPVFSYQKLQFESNVYKMKWGCFMNANEFIGSYRGVIGLLAELSGGNEKRIATMTAAKTFPLWLYYKQKFEEVLKVLKSINEEIKTDSKQVKDMSFFGLTNITDFLANQKNTTDEVIENYIVEKIIIEYKREVYKNINLAESFKHDNKNRKHT